MKKALVILGLFLTLTSCNKTNEKSDNNNTAYLDTFKVLKEYNKYKEEEEKFKVKREELGRPLGAKMEAFRNEAANFQRNAQIKGMAWAQQKGAELQKREQELSIEQESLLRQLQVESDSITSKIIVEVKDFIKEYGKKNNLDYIYGSDENTNNVLYAKEGYDITEKVLKELNDKFSGKNSAEKEIKKDKDSVK